MNALLKNTINVNSNTSIKIMIHIGWLPCFEYMSLFMYAEKLKGSQTISICL